MKARYIAILIAFCSLVALASAQPYAIRANRGLNLRTEPSLNADIAETITAGTVLQVVGESGRWLKIDRNGREVWLANWVDYSRVNGAAPTEAQQPAAPIDNCCGIDRQCQSDAAWEAGYWAYQNGQCAASAQPQPVTPAQPEASAPANVDNCCYVDRQCELDWEWTEGYWAFQNGQCAAPDQPQPVTHVQPVPSTLARPQIEGSVRFVARVEAALDLMQRGAPEWYDYVIRYVDLIIEVPDSYPDCHHHRAYVYNEPPNNVYIETCQALVVRGHSGVIFVVMTLVHEACHKYHQHEGIVYPGGQEDEEWECHRVSKAGAKVLDPAERYRQWFI